MTKLALALTIALCCALAACATPAAQAPANATAPDVDAQRLRFHDRAAGMLAIPLVRSEDDAEQITVVVRAFPLQEFGVTAYYEYDVEKAGRRDAGVIQVSFHGYDEGATETDGGVENGAFVIHYFTARLTRSEFQAIIGGLSGIRFTEQPPKEDDGMACLDGAAYAIEAQLKDGRLFGERSSCRPDYGALASYAAPLFDAARSHFPELAQRLSFVENELMRD